MNLARTLLLCQRHLVFDEEGQDSCQIKMHAARVLVPLLLCICSTLMVQSRRSQDPKHDKRQYISDPLSGFLPRQPRAYNPREGNQPIRGRPSLISSALQRLTFRLPGARKEFARTHLTSVNARDDQSEHVGKRKQGVVGYHALEPVVGPSTNGQKERHSYDILKKTNDEVRGAESKSGDSSKAGSFKIDDDKVKGVGVYQIRNGMVDLEVLLKMFPNSTCCGSEQAFASDGVKAANDFRSRHNAPPLKLNAEMSKEAEEWAKHLSENDIFEHSPADKRKNQGENIAAACNAKPEDAAAVTQRWYNEVCDGYDFSRNDKDWNASHFTALVWKGTTDMGLGFYDKKQPDGTVCRTMVARYRPPGNAGGGFKENVQKGSFDPSKHCNKKT